MTGKKRTKKKAGTGRKKTTNKKAPSRKKATRKKAEQTRESTVVEPILKHAALSLSGWAVETGHDRGYISRKFSEAGVQPCGKRGGYPVYRIRDGLPVLYLNQDGEFDPDKLKPFERNAWYKAEREKLHLQLERADVVPAIEVERKFGTLFKVLVQGLDTLPDVIERDVGATPKQLMCIEKHLDELRNALVIEIESSDDDADRADQESA